MSWLSNLPTGWTSTRLKAVTSLRKARVNDPLTGEVFIGLEHIESWTGRLLGVAQVSSSLDEDSEGSAAVSQFFPGDVLFGKLRPYLAKAYLAKETGFCTTELLVIDPDENLDERFLLKVLLTSEFIGQANAATFGTRMPRAEWDTIANIQIPIPPLAQQRAIAAYLDQQTARLDELIAAKQYLLDLLAEKRQALITHAVTRGLDPIAPLRDSGVPWLGEIPAHWEVVNLKFLADVRTGVAKGRTLDSSRSVKLPYLRVANVQDGYIDLSDVAEIEVLPEEIPNYQLRKDDVLMNEGGDADKLGRGAVWHGSIDPCLHQNHVFAVRCHAVSPIWLSTITGSDYAKAYFESHSKQSTNLASISATNLKELPVVLPPEHEQMQLVHWIDSNLSALNNLQIATRKTVELLQERRSALIAAAVNGQIDVTEQPCN